MTDLTAFTKINPKYTKILNIKKDCKTSRKENLGKN